MTDYTNTIALLKNLFLFKDLSEPDLLFLASQSHIDQFERDSIVFYQNALADRVWILRRGQVKIVFQDEGRREVILEMISPGEPFGGTVLFMPNHPATAQAMVDIETVSFSQTIYSQFLVAHPAVSLKLVGMLGQRLHSLMGMQILAGERVERRLAHILLKLAHRTGRPDAEGVLITIPLSRQDLADMAGTTLETAIRTMSRFRTLGLVKSRRGGYLVLTNQTRLAEIAAMK